MARRRITLAATAAVIAFMVGVFTTHIVLGDNPGGELATPAQEVALLQVFHQHERDAFAARVSSGSADPNSWVDSDAHIHDAIVTGDHASATFSFGTVEREDTLLHMEFVNIGGAWYITSIEGSGNG